MIHIKNGINIIQIDGKSTCAAFAQIAALDVVFNLSKRTSKVKAGFFDQSQTTNSAAIRANVAHVNFVLINNLLLLLSI